MAQGFSAARGILCHLHLGGDGEAHVTLRLSRDRVICGIPLSIPVEEHLHLVC